MMGYTVFVQVAHLATFLLITLFPQTPFVLYFAYIQPVLFPVDPIVGTMMLICLVSTNITLVYSSMRVDI